MSFKIGDRVRVQPENSPFTFPTQAGTIRGTSTGNGGTVLYYHVRLDNGREVFKYSYQLEMLQAYRDTVTHLEDAAGVKTIQPLPLVGIGGAPTRATTLPTEAKKRKEFPVASGFMDYFPDAICAVANLSYVGNEQHNAGQPLHWARSKSGDEADTMMRHFLQRGTLDTDGVRHTVKAAWRIMALLQKELEAETKKGETGVSPLGVAQERCL